MLACTGKLGLAPIFPAPTGHRSSRIFPQFTDSQRRQISVRPAGSAASPCLLNRLRVRCRGVHVVAEAQQEQQEQHSPRSAITQRRVSFRTQHQVNFGEVIKIIGQGPQLGKWDVRHAPAMEWSAEDNWHLEVDLFPGITDFKCAVVRSDGSVVVWEPGANRTVEVPHEQSDSAIHVKCTWSNTGNTIQALSMDEDDTADFVADSMDEEDHPGTFMMYGQARASSSMPNNDTDSPVVPGSTQPESSPEKRQGEFSDVDEGDLEKANQGQMGSNKERVQQQSGAGQKEATTSLPGKRESGQRDQSGVQDDNAQGQDLAPGQGVQLDEVESGDQDLKENPASSRNPKPGLPKAFSNEQPSSSGSSGQSPAQLAAALAGLLAVPVVAWSEYTLKATGCGLPPGPGGLLGAAEGLSYLTVAALAIWSVTSKLRTGRSLPSGSGPLLAGAQKLAFASILSGVAVLGLQVKDYGYIPAALPDANCFGDTASAPSSFALPASSSMEQAPITYVNHFSDQISDFARAATSGQTDPFNPTSSLIQTSAPRPSFSRDSEEEERPAPHQSTFSESAAQSTEKAKKGAGDLLTNLRATYNSVAQVISELDFTPLGKQAIFVKDTLGAGFAGLGKSAAVISSQLAQTVNDTVQGGTTEAQNRNEEVYSGAVDGLSSSDVNAVLEEIEHEADVLKHAFQKAMHRAMGHVALLGTPVLQDSPPLSSSVSVSGSQMQPVSMTSQTHARHRRISQPLLGGVSVQPPLESQQVYGSTALYNPPQSGLIMVAGPTENASPVFLLPVSSVSQAPIRRSQPLWDQQEVALRVLELSVRSMNVPLAQISLDLPSLDLHRMLVEANMMMMGAAASNAVSAANNVNTTLGNAIQQLRTTVDTLKQTVNDVCVIAHRDRVDLNKLYKAVANLDTVLGGAKLTASSVELTPLALQLDDAAAAIKISDSGVEAEQLAGRLVKAAMSLRDTSSSISVTATLENAQRIVSKIPETAANEEDIAPLLQEFEDLTAQLQAELDKLSAVTNHLSPSRL